MKLLKIPWIWVITLALLCGSSCKKDPNPDPSCDDGTCCGSSGYNYKFIASLKNSPADYGNGGFWLKDPVNSVKGILICKIGSEKVEGLQSSYIPNDPNPPLKFRIWGDIFQNLSVPGISPFPPIYEIRIDKVEAVY